MEGCLRGLSGEVVWSCVLARVRMEAENQASDRKEKRIGREGRPCTANSDTQACIWLP